MAGTVHNHQFPLEAVAMDPVAFDNAIQEHGIRMKHWRAMRCPIGLGDDDDVRRAHEHHSGACSNGYIYRLAGTVKVLFAGNSNDTKFLDPGLLDGSSSRITLPRFYDESDRPVHVAYADRFYLSDFETEVPNWETIKAHESGANRLQFPAKRVEHVIDSSGREYEPALYRVNLGKLEWLGRDRPQPGIVCVVWYVYQPYWYVNHILNEVRVAEIVDPYEGAKMLRLNYQVIITRENVFRSQENDPNTPANDRKQFAAGDGSFGAE